MPFRFTGTLDKVVVDLGEAKLSPQDQKELDEEEGTNEVILRSRLVHAFCRQKV